MQTLPVGGLILAHQALNAIIDHEAELEAFLVLILFSQVSKVRFKFQQSLKPQALTWRTLFVPGCLRLFVSRKQ